MVVKKNVKRKKRIRLSHIIIFAFLIYIASIFINQNRLMRNLQSKKMGLEKEISSIEKEIVELNKEVESSDSLEFVEKVAREELGMVKPREIIYIDKSKFKDSVLNIFRK